MPNQVDNIISHIKKREQETGASHECSEEVTAWEIQTNEEHSNGVAKLAGEFAASFDCAEFGRVMGLLHDKGKEQRGFQR